MRGSLQQPERFDKVKLRQAVGEGYADGYPYALILLTNALNNSPLDDVAAYLDELLAKPGQWYNEQEGGGLLLEGIWAGLARRGGLERTVQYVAIFQRPPTAADLSGLLAAMQPPVSFDAASLRQPALRDLLEQSKAGDQTAYNLHPLLRGYALDNLETEAADYRRAAASYLQASYFAAHDPRSQPPRKVEDVQPLLDAFDQLTAAGDYEVALALMFVNVEQEREQLDLYEKLDRWGAVRRLLQMWGVLAESGKLTMADQGVVLSNLGVVYNDLGEYRKAIGYSEQALPIFEQTSDEHGKGNALGSLGTTYSELGEYRKAIGYYEQAWSIFEQTGDERSKGATLGNLGNAYLKLGEYRKAIGYYEQRLKIAERISDLLGQGNLWNNMGSVCARLELYRDALACYLKAQPIQVRLDNPDRIAATQSSIARLCTAVGEDEWPALRAEAERLAADPEWRPALPPEG